MRAAMQMASSPRPSPRGVKPGRDCPATVYNRKSHSYSWGPSVALFVGSFICRSICLSLCESLYLFAAVHILAPAVVAALARREPRGFVNFG
mgnify:CR=1 FL=1